MSQPNVVIRAIDDHIVAIECLNEYTGSKGSFLVSEGTEALAVAESTGPGRWTLRTKALAVEALESPNRIRIWRLNDGNEDPDIEVRAPSSDGATLVIDRGFALYGMGASNEDQTLDRRGRGYRVHHRETGQGNNFMPWILSAQGFGLFVDSSFPMSVDLQDKFVVNGQNIRTYYFINGPTPALALERLVRLTGLPPIHPAWALGYEQSSRTWMGHSELDFVTTYFREKHIPCDGLDFLSTYGGEGGVGRNGRGFHAGYPDFYQGWNVKGTYREYNPLLFSDGAEDVQRLRDRGFHPIVHGYWLADYSDAEATEQYWQDHKYLISDGWEGWWLDGMESVRDAADERRVGHVPQGYLPAPEKLAAQEFRDEFDNVWALLRAKAFYEKQRRDFPDRRVYILNRTAFTGMQRYAAGVNQGDFWSSWELMRIQRAWLLNMALSGVIFPESDIGGFYPTEELTDELFIRWAFMATFAPLMRSHGCNWRCRLPWGFGPENEARFVPLIRLRYAMFPYNYTLARQANQTGMPMIRPMVLEFPKDVESRAISDQYMWGPNVLVAPVAEKGVAKRKVYLPDETWVHGWTMRRYQGPALVNIDAPLGQDPFFFRTGSLIPFGNADTDIHGQSYDELTLLILPDAKKSGRFVLYDDDRRTYGYESGEYSQQEFVVSILDESGSFSLRLGGIEGRHHGVKPERSYRIEVPLSLASITTVLVGGREIALRSPEGPAEKPYWEVLSDRYVIWLADVRGPLEVDFRQG
ncbi:MAG: TIM-barrel domain-containing protein [Dehalococcoidia bacterium]